MSAKKAVVLQQEHRTLMQLGEVRQALATVQSLPDLKSIRDKAEAIAAYTKQQRYSLEIQNAAAEIRLQAERRLGELLREMHLRGGDRKSNRHRDGLKLADLGIDENQSRRWQREAALPQEDFDMYVSDTRAQGEELTSAAVLRLAKAHLPGTPPRQKAWCLEDDVEAIYALWNDLWPHWQTPADKARIVGTMRGLAASLEDPA